MRKELDKDKYKNKLIMYNEVLNEYYSEPYEIYYLIRDKKFNLIDFLIDTFTIPWIATVSTADSLNDLSPYYLVKKDNLKLLVNFKNYVLEVIELPSNTNDKKFVYGKNVFRNSGKVNIFKQV
jgi:hypothetical protein